MKTSDLEFCVCDIIYNIARYLFGKMMYDVVFVSIEYSNRSYNKLKWTLNEMFENRLPGLYL